MSEEQDAWFEMIDVKDGRLEDWRYHAMIMLITSNSKEFFKTVPPEGRTQIRAACTLDGVPVKLSQLIENLGADYDRAVKRAAAELVKERFRKIEDMFYRIERAVRDEFPDLNFDTE